MHGEQRYAVVTPAVPSRERRHRHQLDMRDTQFLQRIELLDGRIERALLA